MGLPLIDRVVYFTFIAWLFLFVCLCFFESSCEKNVKVTSVYQLFQPRPILVANTEKYGWRLLSF